MMITGVSSGGWVEWQTTPGESRVEISGFARFTNEGTVEDPRLVLRTITLDAPDSGGILAGHLDAVGTVQLQALANRPSYKKEILGGLRAPTDSVGWPDAEAAGWTRFGSGSAKLKLSARATGLALPSVKTRNDLTEDFYQRLAEVYKFACAYEPAPVKAIAEFNEIKKTTLRGWINAARRRDLIPAGHKGRVN